MPPKKKTRTEGTEREHAVEVTQTAVNHAKDVKLAEAAATNAALEKHAADVKEVNVANANAVATAVATAVAAQRPADVNVGLVAEVRALGEKNAALTLQLGDATHAAAQELAMTTQRHEDELAELRRDHDAVVAALTKPAPTASLRKAAFAFLLSHESVRTAAVICELRTAVRTRDKAAVLDNAVLLQRWCGEGYVKLAAPDGGVMDPHLGRMVSFENIVWSVTKTTVLKEIEAAFVHVLPS
jgi:hypothetical protein